MTTGNQHSCCEEPGLALTARAGFLLVHTIHPSSRALSLASFQATVRNCAKVIETAAIQLTDVR